MVVSPYDTELLRALVRLEGPEFLKSSCFGKVAECGHNIQLVTPSEYLKLQPLNQIVQPCASSWGNTRVL